MDKSKNITFALIAVEALAIIVLGAFLLQGGGVSLGGLSPDKAGQLAVDFINKNFGDGGTPASLVSTTENSGVYEVKIKFNGSDYTSYVTKNGNLFFTEGINMKPAPAKEFTKSDKPVLDVFVMSFCPFGNEAETTIDPVIALLQNKAQFDLHYILYSKYGEEAKASSYCYDKERLYCSMHGIQELNQDVREMCVAKYQPDKLWGFVKNINDGATADDVDSKWEAIATKIGIDVQKVKDCYKNEATALLKAEADLTSKEYPVQDPAQNQGATTSKIAGSPTFVINGMIYSGARTPEDVKKAVCSAFKTAPAECQETLSATSTTASGSCNN